MLLFDHCYWFEMIKDVKFILPDAATPINECPNTIPHGDPSGHAANA